MYKGIYQLIGSEMSFFTRKLEAQLRFQQIPWEYRFKTEERQAELEARAGTHFIPLLKTPEKWLIHDTIAIGPMLHNRFPEYPVIPDTPLQRACCYILEDAFNHWLGRACVHSRWCYTDNVVWVGARFGANMVLDRSIDLDFTTEEIEQLTPIGQVMYEGFGRDVCEYNGVGPGQAEAVQSDFKNMLRALAEHFSENGFLLGNRPCLADFALAGASKAHFICDPEPLNWLGEHANMLRNYTEQLFDDSHAAGGQWPVQDKIPESLCKVFDYLQGSYFQCATANITAGLSGDKYYEYDYGFGPTKARTQKRLNGARLHVRDELQKTGVAHNADIQRYFKDRQILEYYLDR
ncbi:MAG: glutathione S-transferase C-terminal domain-containing protein [Pseudomonadota bacterium]